MSINRYFLRQAKRAATVISLAALFTLAALGTAPPVFAQSNSVNQQTNYQIPAGSLGQALNEFAQQAGIAIVYAAALVAGKQSPGFSGPASVEQGFDKILDGSGLQAVKSAAGYRVETRPKPSAAIALAPIVVEGERSGRLLDEAPASVVVIDGEQADRPQNLNTRDVVGQVPNVVFDSGVAMPAIRGIDGSGFRSGSALTSGAQPRINVFVDGVPRPITPFGSASVVSSNWETSQVEIARGPQSTLGGRNSLAGSIRVQTNDPVHTLEGALRTYTFDEDGTVGAALMLNAPVVDDQVALRLTGEVEDGQSFVDNTDPLFEPFADQQDTEEMRRYRMKLLVEPESIPDLRILATAERTEDYRIPGYVVDQGSSDELSSIVDVNGAVDNEQDVFSLQANYAISNQVEAELRVARIENETRGIPLFEPTTGKRNISTAIDTDSSIFEGLFRFERIGNINRGVVGFTYEEQDEFIVSPPPFFPVTADGTIESLGIFGEIDYAVTDRLDLIVGARLEQDDRERFFEAFGTMPRELDADQTELIPKIGLRYAVADDVTLGYQYTEGFRPSGIDFDFLNPAISVTFDSEHLEQHEIYTRGTYWGGRATLNASLFYYEFKDAQVAGAGPVGSFGRLIGNVALAEGYGAEVEGTFDFGNGFFLSAGLGMLDTEITDATGSALPQFEGEELTRAPNITGNIGLDYISNAGWDASIRVRHVGEFTTDVGGEKNPAYTTVDLAAGYEFDVGARQTARIDAFVNNATDELIVLDTLWGATGNGQLVGRPRTMGIAASLRF